MITSHQGGNTSFPNFPIRAPFRADNETFGWGGELAKEVAFAFIFFFIILSKPFCDVQWLAGFPFCEAVILYSLFFQKMHLFFFFLFCLTYGLKN